MPKFRANGSAVAEKTVLTQRHTYIAEIKSSEGRKDTQLILNPSIHFFLFKFDFFWLQSDPIIPKNKCVIKCICMWCYCPRNWWYPLCLMVCMSSMGRGFFFNFSYLPSLRGSFRSMQYESRMCVSVLCSSYLWSNSCWRAWSATPLMIRCIRC